MNNIIESKLPKDIILGNYITIQKDVKVGSKTRIWHYVNLYGCEIGIGCMIGTFVEIQKDVIIGNNTRISSHTFVCSNVKIGNDCFIAHGVMFINDDFKNYKVNFPLEERKDINIGDDVIIGSNATILPVNLGNNCIIGAGSVVIKDVPENAIMAGNPARITGYRNA